MLASTAVPSAESCPLSLKEKNVGIYFNLLTTVGELSCPATLRSCEFPNPPFCVLSTVTATSHASCIHLRESGKSVKNGAE
jgi:hypothetical protein